PPEVFRAPQLLVFREPPADLGVILTVLVGGQHEVRAVVQVSEPGPVMAEEFFGQRGPDFADGRSLPDYGVTVVRRQWDDRDPLPWVVRAGVHDHRLKQNSPSVVLHDYPGITTYVTRHGLVCVLPVFIPGDRIEGEDVDLDVEGVLVLPESI